jgi:Predicted transcriptional regulator containing the HTH domain
MPLHVQLEALLFYKAAPQKKTALQKLFGVGETELAESTQTLRARLNSGALRLIETDTELQLATAPELAPFIETIRKQELKADIGKAGAETLAIILYKGNASRSEIDSIRGVNSAFILRTLMSRGLIERAHQERGGGYRFHATTELLAHLGVSERHELTDFATVMNALERFEAETADTTSV